MIIETISWIIGFILLMAAMLASIILVLVIIIPLVIIIGIFCLGVWFIDIANVDEIDWNIP